MNPNKLVYRAHNSSGSMVRVWREVWAGDQFEIMSTLNFHRLKTAIEDANRLMGTTVLIIEEAEDNEAEIQSPSSSAETYPQGSAQQWVEAFKSGNTTALCLILADQFDCRDTSTADDYDVMCFLDGSKAGWKRSGDAWLINGPTN